MAFLDRLEQSIDRTAGKFSSMLGDGPEPGASFIDQARQGGGGPSWGSMAGQGSSGPTWGGLATQGNGPAFSWGGLSGQGHAGLDMSWLTTLNNVRGQAAADKAAQDQKNGYSTTGSVVGTSTYIGSGTASDNQGITGQKVDQFIASKFAGSPLVGKGQLILDYANQKGVSVPEALAIFWKESGMATTAGPGWNIAGLGGAGNFHQYSNVDDAIRGAIDNLASDQYRGKSVQDHIGYWFVGPQRYAQFGLNADDGTGGRNGTVGDYLNNFVAPTYAAFGVGYNQTGVPTRQALPGQGGGDWGAGLIGTPYALGGLRTHPTNPRAGIDCSEFTAYVWGQKGVTLPWNAQQQYNNTTRVAANQLQAGDLVFFHSTDPNDPDYITHVGIYVGNGKMINAQTDGVQYADLNSPYWQQHLAGYGRVGQAAIGGGGASSGGFQP